MRTSGRGVDESLGKNDENLTGLIRTPSLVSNNLYVEFKITSCKECNSESESYTEKHDVVKKRIIIFLTTELAMLESPLPFCRS